MTLKVIECPFFKFCDFLPIFMKNLVIAYEHTNFALNKVWPQRLNFYIKIHSYLDIFFVWNLTLSKYSMNANTIKIQALLVGARANKINIGSRNRYTNLEATGQNP